MLLLHHTPLSRLISQHPCAKAYGQCGGDNWNGQKCCPGTACQEKSQYYSQCLPSAAPGESSGQHVTMRDGTPHGTYHAMSSGVPRGSNQFASHRYYVGEAYQQRVKASMQARWAQGAALEQMTRMLSVPSAFWVDRIAKIGGGDGAGGIDGEETLESMLADAEKKGAALGGTPPLVVAILCEHRATASISLPPPCLFPG